MLEGPIPEFLGNLASVLELHLSYNKLDGRIPDSLGNLVSLSSMDLDDNKLDGGIPDSLGNLRSLSYLDLAANILEGFEILACPCNQFLHQEPGTSQEAEQFACTRFKAEYPIFQKEDIKKALGEL
ncbi:uncharacterized protein [Henckelia pumila]|uniref:uncharacterized protein n=1 Tax=Henckelia pumila TaxID=405737 RepID=UPI003C6E6B7C